MRISDWSSDVCASDLGGEDVRRDADPAVVRPDENCLFCGAAHNGLGIGAAKADVASMALLPCRRHHFNPRHAEPGNQPLRQGADIGGNGLDADALPVSEGFLQRVVAEVVSITVLKLGRWACGGS